MNKSNQSYLPIRWVKPNHMSCDVQLFSLIFFHSVQVAEMISDNGLIWNHMGMNQAGLFCIMAWQCGVWKWLCQRVRNNGWLFTLMSWFGQCTDTNKQRGQRKRVRRVLFRRCWTSLCAREGVCVAWHLQENLLACQEKQTKSRSHGLDFATWHCSLWLNSDRGNLFRGSVSMIPKWLLVSKSAFQTSATCVGKCAPKVHFTSHNHWEDSERTVILHLNAHAACAVLLTKQHWWNYTM